MKNQRPNAADSRQTESLPQPPQKCRRVTPEIAAEILAGINANETTAEIATRLGVSVAAVRKVANTPVPAIH